MGYAGVLGSVVCRHGFCWRFIRVAGGCWQKLLNLVFSGCIFAF